MIHLGDICKINGAEIEPVWCITGGSPCQDLSIAGKRAGLAGARSGLFMEQVRIVKEMREADKRNGRTGDMVRPRYLVWENVVGAFSSNKGKDFAAVLEEIIKIVEPEAPGIEVPEKGWPTWGGYHDEVGGRWSVVWRTHDAQYWGVPQRRRRISVVADFGGDTASEIQFDSESVSGDIAESGASGEGTAEAAESGAGRTGESIAQAYGETGVGYWQNGVQTLRAEGENRPSRPSNVVVCSTGNDQTIFTPIPINLMVATRHEALGRGTGFGVGEPGDPANTISTAHSHGVFATAIPINDKATRWQGGGENRNHDGSGNGLGIGKEGDPSPTLTDGDRHGVMAVALDMTHACDVIRECGEQVPALQARMETGGNQVPLTYGIGNGQAHEGAAMTEEVSQTLNTMHDAQAVMCPDTAHTLRAKANCAYREDAETYPVQNMVVRRLTPMECERLQGFPDHWTDIGEWIDEKGKKHKDADSPRYKVLGNSIALPFWDWMLRRMARYLPEDATLGSLFDGIGGFPLVFERIHGRGTARWASEIEQFPIAVTKKHFPEEE